MDVAVYFGNDRARPLARTALEGRRCLAQPSAPDSCLERWRGSAAMSQLGANVLLHGPDMMPAGIFLWTGWESNPRPSHCERDALPTELPARIVVGGSGIEPLTPAV